MKITLYMAISIDGFVAKKDGDSDWVSPVDSANFEQQIKEKGCIIVGNRTFDQYQDDLYPVKGVTNIVLTSDNLLRSDKADVFYVRTPAEALKVIQEKGHDQALLIGGGTTNGIFLKAGAIDEVILSVHPLILGDGIKIFEDAETDIELEFLDQKKLGEELTQLHYRVIKREALRQQKLQGDY